MDPISNGLRDALRLVDVTRSELELANLAIDTNGWPDGEPALLGAAIEKHREMLSAPPLD